MSLNGAMKIAGQSRGLRLVAGRVDVVGGVPSAAKGAGFTVADVAAGQVKVVLDEAGKEIISAVATPIEGTDATGHSVKVDAKTEASDVTFGVYVADATDGALVDNVGFYFQILVKDYAG